MLHEMGEVFYSVVFALQLNNSDPNGIYIWIEQVGSVSFRLHPKFMDLGGVRRLCYVFGHEREMYARLARSRRKVLLSWKLVGDAAAPSHLKGVLPCGRSETGIEMELRKSSCGPVLICGSK